MYEFGDDGEMARAQFTDHGGVFDDAAGEADVDADDALSSPCFTPPPDDPAEPVVDWHAEYRLLDDAGTPATSASDIPRQPVFTSPASRPMTLTEQQAAMHMQTADARTPSGLLFGASPEARTAADTCPWPRHATPPIPSHQTHLYPAGSRPEALRMGGSVSAGRSVWTQWHCRTRMGPMAPPGTQETGDADTCHPFPTRPTRLRRHRGRRLCVWGGPFRELTFGYSGTAAHAGHQHIGQITSPSTPMPPANLHGFSEEFSPAHVGPRDPLAPTPMPFAMGPDCAHGDPTPRAGASPHRQLEHSQWHAGRAGRAVLTWA